MNPSRQDVDFYAILVESGQHLVMSVSSAAAVDAYLKLFTANGTVLASNDNYSGLDPGIDFDFSPYGAGRITSRSPARQQRLQPVHRIKRRRRLHGRVHALRHRLVGAPGL